MAISAKTRERITEVQGAANQAFIEGRRRFAAAPSLLWGGDDNEIMAALAEAVEEMGWEVPHIYANGSGFNTIMFRRDEDARLLR